MRISMRLSLLSSALSSVLVLSSCNSLSGSGPSVGAIRSDAKVIEAPYVLAPVTQNVEDLLAHVQGSALSAAFSASRPRSSSTIGVGDALSVTIWEASRDGLFSLGVQGSTQIPPQIVSENGTISVPYAGTVKVTGRSPVSVKAAIEKALSRMAVEPQVLVKVVNNNSNAVTVTGEVAVSGRVPLKAGGDRLLDIIAEAGGPRKPSQQLAVQITRGLRTETVPMEELISDPRDNVYVQSDDIVTLIRQPRSFTVFGATMANASIQFDETQLELDQGLAKVGGLNDEKANAQGVFVYRREPIEIVHAFAPSARAMNADGTVNVIYQINLKDPSGFFILKNFQIKNGDLIYIANSSLAEIRKFATLLSTLATPVAQGASLVKSIDRLSRK